MCHQLYQHLHWFHWELMFPTKARRANVILIIPVGLHRSWGVCSAIMVFLLHQLLMA